MILKEAVEIFFNTESIAVTGFSRSGNSPANHIYKMLLKQGKNAYAINPKADQVDGVVCYPDILSLPVKPEAVVVASHPQATSGIVDHCIQLGVKILWIHKSIDGGSYEKEAIDKARNSDMVVIPSGCPMMFCPGADVFHRCMGWFMKKTGKIKMA
ncbi:MAG: CoA-binding protein [Cyclobacteriaceae bacterium]|nr:CoA-binding protein [Cyclobacteriaceae bacterium]